MNKLIREVHRRFLWQALGIYMISGWITLWAAASVTEGFGLPDGFLATAAGLVIFGLPVALTTAFVQAGRPETGVFVGRRPATDVEAAETHGEPASREEDAASRLLTWLNFITGAVVIVVLWCVFAAGWLLIGGAFTAVLVVILVVLFPMAFFLGATRI